MRGGGERNIGSLSGDDVDVNEYIGGSQRSGQPRGRGGTGGNAVEVMLQGCRVPKVQNVGERDPAWVIFFVDDAVAGEVQWRKDGTRWRSLSASLADAQFQMMEERRGEDEPLLPRKKMTGWPIAQGILGICVDTDDMTVGLPERKLEDL